MIVMLDTHHDLRTCEKEVQHPCEQLLTPLTRYSNRHPESHFAIDNGAFSNFDRKGFLSLLAREYERRERCRFVAVPDVIDVITKTGSARRTLEVFEYLKDDLRHWTLALVAQDGLEDFTIPWDDIGAIFIGGSTEWKMSIHVRHIVKAAIAMGKWVHIGRVNTADRFQYFKKMGADSVDGSGISQYSWMRERLAVTPPPGLFTTFAEELSVN
jgi:hypothetical protein